MGLYNEGLSIGDDRWTSNVIKVALVSASYTPDKDDNGYAAFSAYEQGSSAQYTTGGLTMTCTVEVDDTNDKVYLTVSVDPAWTAIPSGSIRYAVIYDSTDDKLIRWLDFTTTRTLSNSNVTLRFTNDRVVTSQAA